MRFTFIPLNFWFIFIKEGIIQGSYSDLQMSAFRQPGHSSAVLTSAWDVNLMSQPGHAFPLI